MSPARKQSHVTPPPSLPANLVKARRHLSAVDPALGRAIEACGYIPIVRHPATLHRLCIAIIGQQLSMQVARVIGARFDELLRRDGDCQPQHLLALTTEQLRAVGLSAAKAGTVHALAQFWHEEGLTTERLAAMADDEMIALLTQVKGIGPWTVKMFLIFSLHRPNVLPQEDLGLRAGMRIIYGLDELPTPKQTIELGRRWEPYCTVGTHYCWKYLALK